MSRLELILILTLASLISVISGAGERCKKSDSECQKKLLQHIIKTYHKKGYRDINLIAFDPLSVKSLTLPKVKGSPVGIELKFKDIELTGISSATVNKVSGLKEDSLGKFSYEIDVKFTKITLSGPYTIDGQVLILPITGKGNCKIQFDDVSGTAKGKGSLVEKNGKKYLTISKVVLDLNPKKTTFAFENLFNGDKALGDNMNIFLNENWVEVFTELKPVIMEAIGKILLHIGNGVFSTIQYADLFLSD